MWGLKLATWELEYHLFQHAFASELSCCLLAQQEELRCHLPYVTNQGIGLQWTDTRPPSYKGNKCRTHPFGFPTGLGPDGPWENHVVTLLVQVPECGNKSNQAWESCTTIRQSGDQITQEKWYNFQEN